MRLVLALAVAATATACGARDPGADGAERRGPTVAVVGADTVTRAQLEAFLADVERAYAARGRELPSSGVDRANVEAAAIELLVERSRERQLARRLGVEVTEADVERELDSVRERLGTRFDDVLAESGVTLDRARENVAARLVRVETFEAVTRGTAPSPEDLRRYYTTHRATRFTRSEPRLVLYLFVKERELVEELRRRIAAGESFEPLAKRYSHPRARKGRIVIPRNEFLPEVERVAFALAEGELSQPIQSPAGWHLVQAISPRPPERVLPFEAVAHAIGRELTERSAREAMVRWLAETEDELQPEYGRRYHPDELRAELDFTPGPQRPLSDCRLKAGNYTYERLVELGCAGDFQPPPGMAPCRPSLLQDPITSGVLPVEMKSGYASYAMDTAPTCHDDPRGTVVSIGGPTSLPYGGPGP